MEDLSLYVLDITNNSVRAGAKNISILLSENGEWLDFYVTDDGCGMTAEQLAKLEDPFFTTRTTRKVGLGIPFLKMLAEMTGGSIRITSKSEKEHTDHGTTTFARFGKNHIDFVPLGDLPGTVVTLIQGSPDIHFVFTHKKEKGTVSLDTAQLKEVLGDDISLAEPEVLSWINENLREQYDEIN